MATTYTSKVTIRCAKQHSCVVCASKYSYVLFRNLSGTGATAAAAEASAEKLAKVSVENDVDYHPCPHCGTVQPEMIEIVQRKRFFIAAGISLVGLGIAAILGFAELTTIVTAAWVAFAFIATAAGIALWACLFNPNRRRDANRVLSEGNVAAGHLRLDEKSSQDRNTLAESPACTKRGHQIAALMSFGAAIAAVMPPVLVAVNGWPRNTTCYPEVVGAGDTARFYFDKEITAVNSMWRGEASVAVLQSPQIDPAFRVSATTKENNWGDSISGKSVSNTTKPMYVDAKFPSTPDLSGRAPTLKFNVNATYPFGTPNNTFDNHQDQFQHTASVVLAPAGAGTRFYRSWWEGLLMAGAMTLVGTTVAYRSSKALAAEGNPTLIGTLGEPT